jgi:hypothetical protein
MNNKIKKINSFLTFLMFVWFFIAGVNGWNQNFAALVPSIWCAYFCWAYIKSNESFMELHKVTKSLIDRILDGSNE